MKKLVKIIIILMAIFTSNEVKAQDINYDTTTYQVKVFNTVKEEYATDPLTKTWNFMMNVSIEYSRKLLKMPEDAIPGFIPMSVAKILANQKKSYEK